MTNVRPSGRKRPLCTNQFASCFSAGEADFWVQSSAMNSEHEAPRSYRQSRWSGQIGKPSQKIRTTRCKSVDAAGIRECCGLACCSGKRGASSTIIEPLSANHVAARQSMLWRTCLALHLDRESRGRGKGAIRLSLATPFGNPSSCPSSDVRQSPGAAAGSR
jgi:hypothetical protein